MEYTYDDLLDRLTDLKGPGRAACGWGDIRLLF